MNVVFILIGAIVIISISAFKQRTLMYRYQFNAYQIIHRKEYIRLLSHGFLHADYMHLFVNMFVLYSFGRYVIFDFDNYFGGRGVVMFLLLFFAALVFSSLYSLFKEKDNPHYNAIGASGAVSAVVFSSIFFHPYSILSLFGILPVPAIVFGIGYLIYSRVMSRKNLDNVGHDAHFWGAVFGFIFPLLYKPSLILVFIDKLLPFL